MFSSIAGLEKLLSDEADILKSFQDFIGNSEENNDVLKNKLEKWQNERKSAEENSVEYLGNPLNAFLLVKRICVDYKNMQNHLGLELKEAQLETEDSDVKGAVEGLLRLQKFYRQKSSDFAKGIIDGVKTREEMSTHDLYIIGREASKSYQEEYFAIEYLMLTWQKIKNESNADEEVYGKNVLLELAELHERNNDFVQAQEILILALNEFPEDALVLSKMGENSINILNHRNAKTNIENPFLESFVKTGQFLYRNEMILYGQTCRGEVTKTPKEMAKLHCKYVSSTFYSKIGPFKVEEANLDPYIVLFVDIISDIEIEVLKVMTKPNIMRATVSKQSGIKAEEENKIRVAQLAWFQDDSSQVVHRITQRVEAVTGLSMKFAEQLQVQNYGIGGHYVPHWDHQIKRLPGYSTRKVLGGNRVATMLFYMSDVIKGGQTVFPYLKTRITARKGSAAFWYNLRNSGDDDYYTRHAACPVLLGNKWVANKWLFEHDQEFRRPCLPQNYVETVELDIFKDNL